MRRHAKAATAGPDRQKAAKFALPVSLFAALLALLVVVGTASAITSPSVTTEPVSNNTGVHATLNGTVNPDGVELSECFFEWGEGFAFDKVAPCAESNATIGTGTSPVAVHADISNLQPNGVGYRFRLVAKNPETPAVKGSEESFTSPNTVIATAATGTTTTSTTLNGTVNPDGVAISECVFEWGKEKGPFDPTQTYPNTSPCVPGPGGIGAGTSPVAVSAALSGLEIGTTYHYRLKAANANGPILSQDASVLTSGPTIVATWSQDVLRSEGKLGAEINPRGSATTYHFEWGTTASYGNQTPELSVGSDNAAHKLIRALAGLLPGTTYHYRVVATSSVATNEGPDRSFTTYAPEPQDTDCSNQENRVGLSADLHDCRAYEMVSPVDKNGGDIRTLANINGFRTAANQATPTGEKLTYSSFKSFGDALSSAYSNQYLATRQPDGWTTHSLSPPQVRTLFSPEFRPQWDLNVEFRAFSEDLSTAWYTDDATPPRAAGGVEGAINMLEVNNQTGGYRQVAPEIDPSANGPFELQGHTPDGSHALLTSRHALTADAPLNDNFKLYDFTGGELHLVSILPGGAADTEGSALGTAEVVNDGRRNLVRNAVSRDGSRIYWSSGSNAIYVRVDGTETVPVSETVSSGRAQFWTASVDGAKALFTVQSTQDLYEFDLATEASTLVAPQATGVLGASDDLSRIYFVSTQVLAPGATAGQPNLYLDREGAKTFVATLSSRDAGGWVSEYDIASSRPLDQSSRVSGDGQVLAFQSAGSLTGYDNTDVKTGEPAVEVYLYDAAAEKLSCISCLRSGARPTAQPLQHPYKADIEPLTGANEGPERLWTAAWLPTAERQMYYSRSLSDDGSRLFFNSFDALVPRDTNGQQDVYEWEQQGTGSCTDPEGCINLISSGQSPEISELVDASASGRDVFFTTGSGLLPQDPGLIDIYDAREGGGFPPAPAPRNPCLGDACQPVPPALPAETPSSASFHGAGNPTPGRSCTAQAQRAALLGHRAKRFARKAQHAVSPQVIAALQRQSALLAKQARALSKKASRCRRAKRGASR